MTKASPVARGAEAPRLLEVEREEICRSAEAGHEQERRCDARGQVSAAEPGQVEQRVSRASFDDDEGEGAEQTHTEAEQSRCRRPSLLRGEGQPHDDENRRGGGERGTGNVESAQGWTKSVRRDRDHGEYCDCGDDRDIHGEDGAPPPGVCEDSAEDGPEDHSRGSCGSPDAQGAVALSSFREPDAEERESRGCQCGTAETLEAAPEDEHPFGDRESAEQRAEHEESQACEEHPATPEGVGQSAAEEKEAAEGDGVGADDPLQSLRGEAE